MSCYYIIGLRIAHRVSNAVKLQQMLTEYGCNIRMRVGMHETGGDFCSDDGIIMLQACGDQGDIDRMIADLSALDGVKAKLIDLN